MGRVATKHRLSPFGGVVMSLAASRGIPSRAELLRTLEEDGHVFGASSVAHWLYGRRPVERKFALAVAEVLEITEGERKELAMAYLHGQEPATASASANATKQE